MFHVIGNGKVLSRHKTYGKDERVSRKWKRKNFSQLTIIWLDKDRKVGDNINTELKR